MKIKNSVEKQNNNNKLVILLVIILAACVGTICSLAYALGNKQKQYDKTAAEIERKEAIFVEHMNSKDSDSTEAVSETESSAESVGETKSSTESNLNVEGLNENKLDDSGNMDGVWVNTTKQYRTLAEAEADMGFSLGLKNDIECNSEYELVSLYNIGSGKWYQAEYENSADINKNISFKVSESEGVETLVAPYNINDEEFEQSVESIDGVEVHILGKDNIVTTVWFDFMGKAYAFRCREGLDKQSMMNIVRELINNISS